MKRDIKEERQFFESRYHQTVKRIRELEAKRFAKTMSRADTFELDMCRGDIKTYKSILVKLGVSLNTLGIS